MSTYSDFTELFLRATGHEPFPYQIRLATVEPAPSVVSVPTGLGKTAGVILSWLWRRRFAGPEVRSHTARRLVYCLPMRVLVEQTHRCAVDWLRALQLLAEASPVEHPADRVGVHMLMGGDLEVDWDRWPDRDQILIGTQDMLLSRALNRGYAMSRFRWPAHFGLLNDDCQWILDEVQLMSSGLATTTQLQAFRRILGTVHPVRSTWMSATLRSDWLETVDFESSQDASGTLQLDDQDLTHPNLRPRFGAIKPIGRAEFAASTDGKVETDLFVRLHTPGTRTLCVVNTVKRAQTLFAALEKRRPRARLVLLHSRFRPGDRARQVEALLAAPDEHGTIAIATQVVEAGVDVSSALLVTDLAPWASMVQRFGRCNRAGELNDQGGGRIVWICPEHLTDDSRLRAAPYQPDALRRAATLLSDLSDAGPRSLPEVSESLCSTHVLRRQDLTDLFDTTPDLAGADLDVSRFIRETDDLDLQVFWRELPARDDPPAELPAPERAELCSVPVPDLRDWLKKEGHTAWRWDHVVRRWIRATPGAVFPGLVLLLRSGDGGYHSKLGWTGKEKTPVQPWAATGYAEANDDDRLSEQRTWMSLVEHTDGVVAELIRLLESPGADSVASRAELLSAARWHDAGKAHPVFQQAIPEGPRSGAIWAKSGLPMRRYGRPGFRHELASALGMLELGMSSLAVYLVAAHHGKVRLSIRSLPHEHAPEGDPVRRFARGIWQGDRLPACDLGGGVLMPETILDLTYMELGEDDRTGPSWLSRMLALRDAPELGPFRLGFLETLLRVADWRASGAPPQDGSPEVTP
jgi:CRISPR-associated endonuclease/helicase Cas3